MTSGNEFAYHMEARRKQRLIERQTESRQRSAAQMAEPEMMTTERPTYSAQQRSLSAYHRQYMPKFGQIARHPEANTVYPWQQVERELRRQEKVLRDHNLTMGPMQSFRQEFDAGALTVKR